MTTLPVPVGRAIALFVAAVLCAALLVVGAVPVAGVAPAAGSGAVFVANGGQGTVSTFTAGGSGAVAQSGSPVDDYAAAEEAVSPDGKFLYVVNTYPGTLSTFSIGSGGALTAVGSPVGTNGPITGPTGEGPQGVAVSPNDKFLFVVNTYISNVVAFSIGSNGAPTQIGSGVSTGDQSGLGYPKALAVSPDGTHLYVADDGDSGQGNFVVSTFSIGSSGALTSDDGVIACGCSGGSNIDETGMVVSPNGENLYTTDGGAKVSWWSIAPGGAVTSRGPVLSGNGAAGAEPAGLVESPDGKDLYVANFGQGTVSTFSIAGDGSITQVGTPTPSGSGPDGVAISSDGRHLYVTNNQDGTVSTFSIAADGALTMIGSAAPSGDSATKSFPVGIGAAPTSSSLKVTIAPTVPPGGLGIGDSLTVPVKVTAGSSALTSVSLGAGLVLGSDAVKLTSTPSGTSGFSLAAGASRSFLYQIKGVKAGTAKLSVTVTAQDADAHTVTASASKSFPVSARALVVTAVTDPKTVKLDVDGKGALVPKTVTVRVRLANTSKAKLTHVRLVSLDPVPADPTQQLDKVAFPKGSLPLKVGTIEGKASFVKTFKLKVTGDGTYVVKSLATYDDPSQSGGNGKAVGQDGRFTVDIPLLYMKAAVEPRDVEHHGGGQVSVDGGDLWYVSGDIRNLSSFQTVCLRPLDGGFGGNAAGLGPHQIAVAPVDGASPPMAGPLKPGESAPFLMRVNTDPNAGDRSTVQLRPKATLGDPGDPCNVVVTEKQPLIAPAKIVTAKDSGLLDVHVSPGQDEANDASVFDFFGEYSKGSAKAYGKELEQTLVLANQYLTLDALKRGIKAIAGVEYRKRTFEALNSLDKTVTLISTFWNYAPRAAKEQLLNDIVDAFVEKTHDVWDGVQAKVSASASTWFDHVVAAWYSGDTTEMLHALRGVGAEAGEGVTAFAVSMAKFEFGLALLKKGAELTKTFVSVAGSGATWARLSEVPAGALLNLDEMTRLWGLSKQDWEAYRSIAAEEKVLIGVRGRAPISVKNLEEGAVWKHENLKPKNVNVLDIDYLGFDSHDNGLVAFRTYTDAERTSIINNIHKAKLTNAQKNVILKRAEVRFNERDYLPKIEGFAKKGEIDVGINYQDNGIDRESTSDFRKFTLKKQDLKGGGVYYRPLQENPELDAIAKAGGKLPDWCHPIDGAALCRVTGDMDGVYITNLDGTSLSAAKRVDVYKRLISAGWQHPETLTWLRDPETFYFSAKDSILSEQALGGTPMIEFGPDRDKQFATYLDLKKSVLLSPDLFYLDIVGGHSAR